MTIQEFGNAFKALINRDGAEEQKSIINNTNIANFYQVGTNYAPNNSVIIDAFYNDAGGDVSQLTTANLRAAAGQAGVGFTYTFVVNDVLNIPGIIQLTNIVEDWRVPVVAAADATGVAGHDGGANTQGRISDAMAGYIFARIWLAGWNESELDLSTHGANANHLKVKKGFTLNNTTLRGILAIFNTNRYALLRAAVDAADTVNHSHGNGHGANGAEFTQDNLKSATVGHNDIIDAWFNRQRKVGIAGANYLTPAQVNELHRLGYEPKEIINSGANTVRIIDAIAGGNLDGFAAIAAVHKTFAWRAAVDVADTVNHSHGNGHGANGAEFTQDNLKSATVGHNNIIDAWLSRQIEVGIAGANYLTPAQVNELHRLGYEPKEIINSGANTVRIIDAIAGGNLDGFAAIAAVHKTFAWRVAVDVADTVNHSHGNGHGANGAEFTQDNLKSATVGHNNIIDAWLSRQIEVGIAGANYLTPAQVNELHRLGYEPKEIINSGANTVRIIDAIAGGNLDGFAAIAAVHKTFAWRAAVDVADTVNHSHGNGHGANGAEFTQDNLKSATVGHNNIIDAWLSRQIEVGIAGANYLTPAQVNELHRLGYEPKEIINSGANTVRIIDAIAGGNLDGFAAIAAVHKTFAWRAAVDVADTVNHSHGNGHGANGAEFTQDNLKSATVGHNNIIDAWLSRQIEVGIAGANYLTPAQVNELHRLGYEPKEIINSGANTVRIIDAIAGGNLDGFAAIAAVHKTFAWRVAVDVADTVNHSHGNGHGANGAEFTQDNLKSATVGHNNIIDAWLSRQIEVGIAGANYLTPAQVNELHRLGYEPKEIINSGANTVRIIDAIAGGNLDGFAAIAAVHKTFAWRAAVDVADTVNHSHGNGHGANGAEFTQDNLKSATVGHNNIIDAWLSRQIEVGIAGANYLTPAQVNELHRLGYEPKEIINSGANTVRIIDAIAGGNLDGFAAIAAVHKTFAWRVAVDVADTVNHSHGNGHGANGAEFTQDNLKSATVGHNNIIDAWLSRQIEVGIAGANYLTPAQVNELHRLGYEPKEIINSGANTVRIIDAIAGGNLDGFAAIAAVHKTFAWRAAVDVADTVNHSHGNGHGANGAEFTQDNLKSATVGHNNIIDAWLSRQIEVGIAGANYLTPAQVNELHRLGYEPKEIINSGANTVRIIDAIAGGNLDGFAAIAAVHKTFAWRVAVDVADTVNHSHGNGHGANGAEFTQDNLKSATVGHNNIIDAWLSRQIEVGIAGANYLTPAQVNELHRLGYEPKEIINSGANTVRIIDAIAGGNLDGFAAIAAVHKTFAWRVAVDVADTVNHSHGNGHGANGAEFTQDNLKSATVGHNNIIDAWLSRQIEVGIAGANYLTPAQVNELHRLGYEPKEIINSGANTVRIIDAIAGGNLDGFAAIAAVHKTFAWRVAVDVADTVNHSHGNGHGANGAEFTQDNLKSATVGHNNIIDAWLSRQIEVGIAGANYLTPAQVNELHRLGYEPKEIINSGANTVRIIDAIAGGNLDGFAAIAAVHKTFAWRAAVDVADTVNHSHGNGHGANGAEFTQDNLKSATVGHNNIIDAWLSRQIEVGIAGANYLTPAQVNELHRLGYEPKEIINSGANTVRIIDAIAGGNLDGFAAIAAVHKTFAWRVAVDVADTVNHSHGNGHGANGAEFTQDNLKSATVGHNNIIDAWLSRQIEVGIAGANYLTPAQVNELHRLGYEPKEIINSGANTVRIIDAIAGGNLDGFAAIAAVHKTFAWRAAVDVADTVNHSHGNGHGANGAEFTQDNLKSATVGHNNIIDAWLSRQIEVGIAGANYLTPAQVNELHRLGYEPKEIINSGANTVRIIDAIAGGNLDGFAAIAAVHKTFAWRVAVDVADTVNHSHGNGHGANGAEFTQDNLKSATVGHNNIIDAWLSRQIEVGIAGANYLTPAQVNELHRLGYEPKEIINSGANTVRIIDAIAGGNLDGFAAIAAVHKTFAWRAAVDVADTVNHSHGNGHGANGAEFTQDNLKSATVGHNNIIDAWLSRQIEVGIAGANYLTPAQVNELHRLGYEPKEIINSGANTVRIIDAIAGGNLDGFAAIAAVHKTFAWRAAVIAHTDEPVSPPVGPYKSALIATDRTIIDSWLTLTIDLTTRLTVIQCQELHRLGWSPTDINNVGGIAQGINPANAALLNDFNGIRTVNKFVVFEADFRTVANGTANKKAHNELNAATGTKADKNFIIEQFDHGINAADAVTAYNNGWIYGSEIRINGGNREYSTDGGGATATSWVAGDWALPANSRDTIKNAITDDLLKKKMDAYQGIKVGTAFKLWIPVLDAGEKDRIRNAIDQAALDDTIKNIDFAHYRVLVRTAAATAVGTAAATDLASFDADPIIDDFFQHSFIEPAIVISVYNDGWVYGREVKKSNTGGLLYCINGDYENSTSWKPLERTVARDSILTDVNVKAKADAFQLSALGTRWNRVLSKAERKYLRDATVANLAGRITDLSTNQTFFDTFIAVTGSSKTAPYTDIKTYLDKGGLTGAQAAALYNETPRILASVLKNDGTVDFFGTDGTSVNYNVKTSDGIVAYQTVVKAVKDAADLLAAINTAKSELDAKANVIDTATGKKSLTEKEITDKLAMSDAAVKSLIEAKDPKTWEGYLSRATNVADLAVRRGKVEPIIEALKAEQGGFDSTATWTKMIGEVEKYWTSKLGKGKAENKIDDKTIDEVLVAGWKAKPTDTTEIDSTTKIGEKKKILIAKIDAAHKKEDKSKKVTPAEVKKSVGDKYAPGVEMKPEVVTSYVEKVTASPASPFKVPEKVAEFLEDAKVSTKKADFVNKVLNKLTGANKVDGTNDDEKFVNFITNKKVDEVIKLAIRFRLEDDKEYLKKARERIKVKEKQSGQELSLAKYTKEGNDYTKVALELFLFEEEDGATHEYVDEKDNREYREKKNNTENPPWYARWGYAPLWGPVVLIGGVALWYYWDKITGPSEEEEDSENASE